MKSADKQALLEAVRKANTDDVEAILKEHCQDEEARASLSAVAKLLIAKKGKITPELLAQVLKAAGYDGVAKKEPSDEDKACAEKAAKDAYNEHMKKLGYQMYPPGEIRQKAHSRRRDDEDEEEEDDVEKSAEKILKSLLAKVPEEGRAAVEAVFKQNETLVAKQAALEKQNTDLGTRLDAVVKSSKRGEFIAKVRSWEALGVEVEKTADLLMTVQEKCPQEYEALAKMFDVANEAISKSTLFGEVGSSRSDGAGITSWDKFEKAANEHVAKSGGKDSGPAAIELFMKTDAGRQMYAQYQRENARRFNTGEDR